MELDGFMVESASLDLDQFKTLHETPTLVFTPEMLTGMTPDALRVDTPGSRVMRLEKTGDFAQRNLAGIMDRLQRDFNGGETQEGDDQEDLYKTHDDSMSASVKRDTKPLKVAKVHTGKLMTGDDEEHASSGRVCKVTKGTRNPFTGFITIGRATTNDIVIDNSTVSKVHALIIKMGKTWHITDQGSTNRTYLNGKMLEAKKPYALHCNDKLSFGRESFATFFMPEGLWRFMSLCNALDASRSKRQSAPDKKANSRPTPRNVIKNAKRI